MPKTKKNKLITSLILGFLLILLFLFLSNKTEEDEKQNNNESLTVCYAPKNCKTINGVSKEAVLNNIIGHPKDFHQENSNTIIDIQAGFDKGRFDEKSFYFSYENKVYYFINAKIFTGFSEDAGLLEKSNAETFELIDSNFSKDKKNVYGRVNLETPIATKIIIDADPKTFTPLDWPYAKDKKNVYYLNIKIDGADLDSFKVLDNKLCGQDKNNYYKDGQITKSNECQLTETN